MDILSRLNESLSDGRLGFNVVAIHGVITATMLTSLFLRRLITHSGSRLGNWTGVQWLSVAGEEAAKRVRSFLFWLTLAAILLTIGAGAIYHMAGRDIRTDVRDWYYQLTVEELITAGFRCGLAVAALVAAWAATRTIRKAWPVLEANVLAWIGVTAHDKVAHRISGILRWYTLAVLRLAAVWFIARILVVERPFDDVFGFLMRIFTFLVLARLLTLSTHVLRRVVTNIGARYLSVGKFHHYWEGVTRLFPLGERCFDACVYVGAASLCLTEFGKLEPLIRTFAPRVMGCIGILFLTRVLIELFQVLVGEAFGLYKDNGLVDQKKQTLVPLLSSVSQYVFYPGSVILMLDVLGVNTTPFLAGAGILGLAVGLGAQNLVTDVVSGFFILFETQFLVGDYVRIGDAAGRVEAVGIRVTQIRDDQGKVHIIPNGQIKGVISYSKAYVNAVVDLKVPSGTSVEDVFRAMAEAGRRLRHAHHEAISDTQIHGLIELNTSDMTIRAVTRVKPGTHGMMQNEYRRILKEILDQNAAANRPALAA
jgi:small conductance mechanosensitive channel